MTDPSLHDADVSEGCSTADASRAGLLMSEDAFRAPAQFGVR